MSSNVGSAASMARMKQISDEFRVKSKEIEDLYKEIDTINERLGEIAAWREKMVKWANEKHRKEDEALEDHYADCLDNEQNDD